MTNFVFEIGLLLVGDPSSIPKSVIMSSVHGGKKRCYHVSNGNHARLWLSTSVDLREFLAVCFLRLEIFRFADFRIGLFQNPIFFKDKNFKQNIFF